ncbi:GNAT family N-acetyltransferase [Gulosibacter molinativorax]|uniref:GNAT family N-acetyltransferase n=1 Tax=Gulosibacter molinativorax TaxID=256821 RepID=A0ABT7C715_9MICO|nr:GNAT family N-acetyltransferase [Gulosibacter molinativorax]MDJ1371003.1 GNAT family N-acetyltransferase [Gulosibacter molinativorax]
MTDAFIEGLERRVFPPGPVEAPLTAEVKAWLVGHEISFQLPPGSDAKHETLARSRNQDDARFTGVYDSSESNLYDREVPVATYITYDRTLNVGAGRAVPARLITGVGVRTEYQGRGILRRVMTDDLTQAQQEGLPVAALTATEGSLYERYGFGAATFQRRVELDARRARFRTGGEFDGRVRQISRDVFEQIAAPTFDKFHARTLGSIGRAALTPAGMTGEFGFAQADLDSNPNRRFAAHVSPDTGEIDGYVAYVHTGWPGDPRILNAVDIVAADRAGYLALWHFLATQSLTDVIRFGHAAAADVLPWALTDARAYRVVAEDDLLWLRILDVERALAERAWLTDGAITIRVADALGLVDGTYRLQARAGRASVARTSADADVEVDASALASLYLGGVSVHQLLGTGLITATGADAIESLQRLFTTATTPYTNTVF